MNRGRRALWLALAVAIAWLDLWSKDLWQYPAGGGSPRLEKVVVEGWLYVRTIWNFGGVWSLPLAAWLLKWATTLAIPAIVYWILLPRKSRRLDIVGKVLVLGGAIGNCWDRWIHEAVRDWVDVCFGNVEGWHWPTFNVADASLVVGIVLLLVASWGHKKP